MKDTRKTIYIFGCEMKIPDDTQVDGHFLCQGTAALICDPDNPPDINEAMAIMKMDVYSQLPESMMDHVDERTMHITKVERIKTVCTAFHGNEPSDEEG